jgi:hypothetical protein
MAIGFEGWNVLWGGILQIETFSNLCILMMHFKRSIIVSLINKKIK